MLTYVPPKVMKEILVGALVYMGTMGALSYGLGEMSEAQKARERENPTVVTEKYNRPLIKPKYRADREEDVSGYKGMPFGMLERALEESRGEIYTP